MLIYEGGGHDLLRQMLQQSQQREHHKTGYC